MWPRMACAAEKVKSLKIVCMAGPIVSPGAPGVKGGRPAGDCPVKGAGTARRLLFRGRNEPPGRSRRPFTLEDGGDSR